MPIATQIKLAIIFIMNASINLQQEV